MRALKRLFFLLSICVCGAASSQTWPNKPVRLITAFGAGSGSDQIARIVAEEFQATFKQPFVVDNKPGGNGLIAAEAVIKAPSDGYTIMLTPATIHAANPALFKKLPYDPIRDFTAVGRVCLVPNFLLVDANLPVRTTQELIEYGRSKRGGLSYGYGNSSGQVAGAAFSSLTKMDAIGIPYKSTPQVLTDIIGGNIAFTFVDLISSQALIKAGRLRAISVGTEQRSSMMPDLPTVAVSGDLPGFELIGWAGVVGPANMPADIVSRLNEALGRGLMRRDIGEKLLSLGCEVAPQSATEFGAFMNAQKNVWARKVKEAGVQAE